MSCKRIIFFGLVLFSSKCSLAQGSSIPSLKALRWIEGNWKGMDGTNPFYEIYKLRDYSTLIITSYEWNGKDSSKTSTATLKRKDGSYYLGDQYNWKVTALAEDTVFMEPVFRASNTIQWKKRDKNTWEAILESRSGRKTYLMERVNHFGKE